MIKILSRLSFLLLLLVSCRERNPLEVSLKGIETEIVITRLDQELNTCKDFGKLNAELLVRYPDLWPVYTQYMLKAGSPNDSLTVFALERFVNDPVMKEVCGDVDKAFGDLNWLKEDLELSFSYLKYYFPDATIPEIVVYNSAFNYGVSSFEKQIGIGIEMYLGPDNKTVKLISTNIIPQYMKDKMIRDHLLVDIMRGWFEANYMTEPDSRDFLGKIIYEGKILYAMDALLPSLPDHLKIRYTSSEINWCEENEGNIWQDISADKLLYSTDELSIAGFTQEAPFTSGLPQNSPGRVGCWLGWRMVRAFMQDHPELKLPDLLAEKNPKKILKSYKPEKK